MAALYRMWKPEMSDPEAAGACLQHNVLFLPHQTHWRSYLLHALWPLESGYVRSFFTSTAVLLQGYALEYEIGTLQFTALLLGLHVASAAVLLHFRFLTCHISLESVLAALTVVMHRVNPQIHTDGLDKAIRVPFAVEPRWHMWIIQALLVLMSSNFPQTLAVHAAGLVVGTVPVLRDPETWQEGWRAVRMRSFGVGAIVHVSLLMFTVLFMPLTAVNIPDAWLSAVLDGRVLRASWWRAAVPCSAPLLHMALASQIAAEALFICKILVVFACPLLLSPFRIWTRFYAVACVLLAMYAMNSSEWRYPHVGFVSLLYLAWAFWKLPNMQFVKEHNA
jgi:hypothetical protein